MERPGCSQTAFSTSKRVEGQLKEIEDKAARKKEEVRFWKPLMCLRASFMTVYLLDYHTAATIPSFTSAQRSSTIERLDVL